MLSNSARHHDTTRGEWGKIDSDDLRTNTLCGSRYPRGARGGFALGGRLCYDRGMVRVVCPHCASPILLLVPADDEERVTCPACLRSFVPDEQEWVDPEDE